MGGKRTTECGYPIVNKKMKKIYKLFVLILILALIEIGVIPVLFGQYPTFSIIFSFCVALAAKGWKKESLWTAFVGGLFLDLIVFRSLGLTSVTFVLFSWLLIAIYRVTGFKLPIFVLTTFSLSFLFRFVFGSFQFSWIYLLGAAEDLILSLFFLVFFLPVLRRTLFKSEKQLSFYRVL